MTSPESAVPPLSEAERARLRPSVDVAALERWLAATNDDIRIAIVAHFATEITADDLRAVGKVVGATTEDLALWDAAMEAPLELGPLHVPGPDAPPNAVSFRSVPMAQPVLWIEPPDDPALASLWSAIEPSR
jgi:hypothetical protein